MTQIQRVLAVTLAIASLCSTAHSATAQETPTGNEGRPGYDMIFDYFRQKTDRLSETVLDEIKTREDWQATRPRLKSELLEMLGLDPMPEKTPLNPVVTGVIEGDGFNVEKLYFESSPGLYVTGDLYVPHDLDENTNSKMPAILYVCGHAGQKSGGVSYGNKWSYHHHGVWFAKHGYVTLIIDSLQLGEIEGIHHGTHTYGRWWWNSRGYSPAAVEAWNGIRAIDYLTGRPEVDADRIGMTGRSGGGAHTWWLAAIDDRIKAAVPVAGIADLRSHIYQGGGDALHDGVVEGHCDCMYLVNTYRWDYTALPALVAPRALLISNSDKDPIFPLEGVLHTHAAARKIYRLMDSGGKLGLQITEGPHEDRQVMRVHAFAWMNQQLKGEMPPNSLIYEPAEKMFTREQLRVLHSIPSDEINTRVDELFVPTADQPKLPESPADWTNERERLMGLLRTKVFGGHISSSENTATMQLVSERRIRDLIVTDYQVETEPGLAIPMRVIQPSDGNATAAIVDVLDDAGWDKLNDRLVNDTEGLQLEIFAVQPIAVRVFIAPRGIGPTAWAPHATDKQTQIRRRFMLLGETLDSGRVWDVVRSIEAIRQADWYEAHPITIRADGDMAGIALYAALMSDQMGQGVDELRLTNLTPSHMQGPELLNVMRFMDIPVALGMAAEKLRRVAVSTEDGAAFGWATQLGQRLGWDAARLSVFDSD